MSEYEQLQAEIKELREQLAKQKKTNTLLKKRAVQAIVGGNSTITTRRRDFTEEDAPEARMELANRVKSVFLENVSHEIRSSMNGIIGMTNLVLETELRDDQRLFLEMVSSSVDRLLVVVNEVLDFSRIETGELDLEPEDFNLKQSLDHDLYLQQMSAEKKGVELTCTMAADVPESIHGDAARINQVLCNLVSNGIKYTDQGSVSITIANNGYDEDGNIILHFTVRDTGSGIPREKLELISHYFAHDSRPHVPLPLSIGSTGLGLTISAKLVKIMGGEIGVDSGPKGTSFWFTVPCKEVADISRLEEQASATVENIKENVAYILRGARVLLAEDEHINRVLIATILEGLGVVVTAVDSGPEAVHEAASGKYQLVLMDVQMEGMDGLQATRKIREIERRSGSRLPIIALTALALPGDRERCLQAGMDDYLAKPVEKEELVSVLASFLSKRALVMDGDPASKSILVKTLIEAGYQVTIAETRRAAMYEASLSNFELILFDLSSPELHGLETATLIRRLETYSGRKTILLGIGDTENDKDLRQLGFDGQLERPVTVSQIHEYLAARPPFSSQG